MGGIALIIFLILSGLTTLIGLIAFFATGKDSEGAKWTAIVGACFVALFAFITWCNTFVIVDAGEVCVEVLFGKVQETTLTEGWQSKNLFAGVVKYSTRLREYTMSVIAGEGAKHASDAVSIRTKDNSLMSIDATIVWAVNPAKAFDIYKKVSTNMDNLESVIIRPNIRSIMRDVGATYTLDSIMKQREQYGDQVLAALIEEVSDKGLIIDNVLIRDISPPESVDASIQDKLKAEQDLAKKEFQKKMAEEDAEIKRIEAKGIADAQEIIQKKLTPLYVQYYAIENYKELAKSPNTTFIIAPTSPNGSGMPLILGGAQ